MRKVGLVGLAAVVVAAVSCGDVVRSNDSPVILSVSSLTAGGSATFVSDVIADGTVTNDMAAATLIVSMKDFSVAPTTNNQVTINRYHVQYRRADGHNIQGVDVPFAFDGAVTVRVTPNTAGSVAFEIVRHVAKEESPLVELRSNPNVISTIADVTFYGTDLVGNDVAATGSMQINFTNLGT